jgi:hypothetical protein
MDGDDQAGESEPGAPSGRTGEVEEADIYKVENNRLFYLNTYRGFVIYDVNDPKHPKRISRLPVFGYPIEMFIDGNTVYALLRDALYLTQKQGKLQFERHNVSQLVSIDISDIHNPKVLKKIDIIGELREGVSRKIENTIYVVSYIPQYYWWGWRYQNNNQEQKEQAWVYSFNVADPTNLKLVEKLQLFEGGSYQIEDPITGGRFSERFSGVALSATSNALMVVENWYRWGYVNPDGSRGCGTWENDQEARVSVVDISDPQGSIKVHTKFNTSGSLTDQFKMTYVYDEGAKTGTFFGIFARNSWISSNCEGERVVKNTLESWDITDGDNPSKLDQLEFGKPNETVRGSTYDADRGVAYAITARAVDPLYVLSIADRTDLKVLSAIDGLSGDMNVFRLIAGKEFLMGIGRDNSSTCTGFAENDTWRATNVAVSLIDVRDLNAIRLVQRACVAVENASWVGSAINWNLDQAHKMIGMYSDADVNVITVPVYYYKKNDENGWWWYRYETAVGMMTWDLDQYDDTKTHLEQQVLQNYGTFIHPNGQVRRSIVFKHQSANPQRMMINLSDTHVSVANIQDLKNPRLESIIEIAPYYGQIYRFDNYMVEHVQASPYYYWRSNEGRSEFRIKAVGGDLEDSPVLASFSVGQVSRVLKHGDNLVLFRYLPREEDRPYYYGYDVEALVYDLSNPLQPKMGGRVQLPERAMPYYRYWCGLDGYWGGYWFYGDGRGWAVTETGISFLTYSYDYQTRTSARKLVFLDLQNPQQPTVSDYTLSSADDWTFYSLVPDPMDKTSFYLAYRIHTGSVTINGQTMQTFKYYAQQWKNAGSGWVGGGAINLPGRLIKTWESGQGERLFLTHDYTYRHINDGQRTYWRADTRINLLREISLLTKPVAELLDSREFTEMHLQDLVADGDKLFVNGRKYHYYWYYDEASPPTPEDLSDRMMIYDLSNLRLDEAYNEPTMTANVQLMGTYQGNLFVNLPGDGILVVDVSDPTKPQGQQFMRTLGYASHIEFADNVAYVAAGYFGIYKMDLIGPSLIPTF